MTKSKITTQFFLLIALVIFACNSPKKSDSKSAFTDSIGQKFEFSTPPKRVISLVPSITELMYAIGAEQYLVARSKYCDFPKNAEKLPAIETYPEVSIEQVLKQKPDLVLSSDEIISVDIVASLKNYKIPTMLLSYNRIDDIFENIELLSKLFEMEKRGELLSDSLKKVEKSLQKSIPKEKKQKVFVLISIEPLISAGKNSYMNDLLKKAGAENICEDLPQKYPEITPEFLLKNQPNFILRSDGSFTKIEDLVALYPMLNNLEAIENEQIISISPDYMSRPGPRIYLALEQLIMGLYRK